MWLNIEFQNTRFFSGPGAYLPQIAENLNSFSTFISGNSMGVQSASDMAEAEGGVSAMRYAIMHPSEFTSACFQLLYTVCQAGLYFPSASPQVFFNLSITLKSWNICSYPNRKTARGKNNTLEFLRKLWDQRYQQIKAAWSNDDTARYLLNVSWRTSGRALGISASRFFS